MFLTRRAEAKPITADERLERRRQKYRDAGVPEEMIDAEIAKALAKRAALLDEAGVGKRPVWARKKPNA